MRLSYLLFVSLFCSQTTFAQFIQYGYDSKSLGTKKTVIILDESDSIYSAALERIRSEWKLTAEVSMINVNDQNAYKVAEGDCAIVPVIETLPSGEANYRLTFFVAKKDFSPVGNQVNGYYIRVANGEAIASLVINPEHLHSVHCSSLIMGVATLAKATSFMTSDNDKVKKWAKNYSFSGMEDVVFEPSDLDDPVKDQVKLKTLMFKGVVMTDEMRQSADLFVKNTRGFAFIATEYRTGEEALVHKYFVVPGKAMVYLQSEPWSKHPRNKYDKNDLFIYGKAQREG